MENQETHPVVALGLAWLIPGAGHLYRGKPKKALLFFLCLVPLYGVGLYLGSRPAIDPSRLQGGPESGNPPSPISIISPKNHPFNFAIQLLVGLPTMAAAAVNRGAKVDSPTIVTDLGLVVTCVVGALNLLLMVDAYCGTSHAGERTDS